MIKQDSSIKQAVLSQSSENLTSNGTTQDSLPKGWRKVRLGDVFKFTKKPKDLRYSMFEYIPFVPMDLIPIGCVSFDRFIFKTNDALSSGTYFEVGDILIAKITPSFENGKQGIIEKLPTPFGIATTEVIPLKQVEGTSDKYYLFYYLLRQEIRNELAGKMEGSTGRQRLSITTLASLELPLPPLSQQRAIAKLLRTAQEAIKTRRDELELEHERKSALMEYLFTYGAFDKPRKQSEIGEIPEDWQVVTLDRVCLNIVDCPHTTPHFQNSGTLVVRNFNIREGMLVLKPAFYTTEEEYKQRVKRCEPREGDVLFSREAPVGEACLIPTNTRLSLGQRMMLLRTDASKLNNYFLVQAFYSKDVRSRMLALASGVTAKHLNVADVRRLKIPLPPIFEQNNIADLLLACDNKITTLQQETSLLEELFRALLEELMTGRLSTLPLIAEGETYE